MRTKLLVAFLVTLFMDGIYAQAMKHYLSSLTYTELMDITSIDSSRSWALAIEDKFLTKRLKKIKKIEEKINSSSSCFEGAILMNYQVLDNSKIKVEILNSRPSVSSILTEHFEKEIPIYLSTTKANSRNGHVVYNLNAANNVCQRLDNYYNLGVQEYQNENYERAKDFFQYVIDLNPFDEEAWYNLILSGIKSGKKQEACNQFKVISAMDESFTSNQLYELCEKFVDFDTILIVTDKKSIKSKIEPPRFSQGHPALVEYLNKYVIYPDDLIKSRTEGRVLVQFTINVDGSLSDYSIIQDICAECGSSVVNALKRSNGWEPATENGKKVASTYQVSYFFSRKVFLKKRENSNR